MCSKKVERDRQSLAGIRMAAMQRNAEAVPFGRLTRHSSKLLGSLTKLLAKRNKEIERKVYSLSFLPLSKTALLKLYCLKSPRYVLIISSSHMLFVYMVEK